MERRTVRYPNATPSRKFRGFRIGRRLAGVFRWAQSRRRRARNPFSMILNAARRGLGCRGFGYSRLGPEEPSLERRKPWDVPKGHLAVNVEGGAGGDKRRVLVPVVYVNHPLFGDLLREAERVYGYEHDGGIITLPCGISELARVHDRIAAGEKPQRQRNAACCWTTNSNSKRRLLV